MKTQAQAKRELRIRKKIRSTGEKPRLSIFRSNNHVYAQIIDDATHKTLLGVVEKKEKKTGTKTERAKVLGIEIAKQALAKNIKAVVFDKGRYAYHGRVKAIAEGAREGGLIF